MFNWRRLYSISQVILWCLICSPGAALSSISAKSDGSRWVSAVEVQVPRFNVRDLDSFSATVREELLVQLDRSDTGAAGSAFGDSGRSIPADAHV